MKQAGWRHGSRGKALVQKPEFKPLYCPAPNKIKEKERNFTFNCAMLAILDILLILVSNVCIQCKL
jgi:hypothetical protein